MAERRMFSKKIIDSDAFLDMPATAQLLYFHLSMRADDDGFVNKPKTIMRMIGSKDDDIKLLFAKKFLIPFDSGIVVIKHWKIHNYIAKDRYKETTYKEEKATLSLDENNSYTTCIQSVNSLHTQVREGKESIDKNSIEEERKDEQAQQIADLFNSLCPSFSTIQVISETMKKDIAETLKLYTDEQIKTAFTKAEQSSFLKGKNERKWKASFAWLIKAENIAKVLNGQYDDQSDTSSRSYDLEAYERMTAEKVPVYASSNPELQARADALKQQLS